jgi:F0F1-type ATP synthase membrane subunit b/b'
MAESEKDVIDHLLSVEHEAAGLVQDAQVEADKRIAAAKAKADAEYKKKYDKIIADLESDYSKKITEVKEAHKKSSAAYKDRILATKKDTKAFNELLDSLLFETA